MNIAELVSKLEEQINHKIHTLTTLGKEAKELQKNIDKLYLKMAAIWCEELKAAEGIVKQHNPELIELFDTLETVYQSKGDK